MVQNLMVSLEPPSPLSMEYTASAAAETDVNIMVNPFSQIPLTALSQASRRHLSRSLNMKKLLRSEDGYERDWRGIAYLSEQKALCDESAIRCDDPMGKVLQLWCKHNAKTATFENLERFLGFIDRWDVCDDIYENLTEDAKNYTEKLHQKSLVLEELEQKPFDEPTDDFGLGSDPNILTKDDVLRAQKGLPPQQYDAFVLFADADIDYVVEILTKLEENPDFNFKFCLKDHLLAGVSFAHVALTQLIEERCKHLIVILTKEFLKSPENKFLVNYTQALQIEHRTRKIIPLLYEDSVKIPRTLQIYTHLKYNSNAGSLYDFWSKLAASIRNVNIVSTKSPTTNAKESNAVSLKSRQNAVLQKTISNLPSPPTDIPDININGNVFLPDDDIPKKKERSKFKKRGSLRNSGDKLMIADGLVLRNAHSTSQLNAVVLQDSNLNKMADLSSSTCSSDAKKKKKWPSKLFKKVFSRSSNRLQEAVP